MSNSSSCINDVLPLEILQKIFVLSAESFKDALSISTTCRLWRKFIYDAIIIERYWTFDNEHRKRGLVYWWDFDRNVNGQNNPFADFPTKDCFLGKCASLTYENENSTQINIDESKYTIDRGADYTLALWLLATEIDDGPYCVCIVCDDDYDYARSAGVTTDENKSFAIVFASAISQRMVESNVQIKPNEWFHIVLVQERQPDKNVPRQNLWINGKLELIAEVPIAAYSSTANISFCLYNEWNHSVADVSIWSRPLLPIEIRAIYEQKTSIDKVNIAKYIIEHVTN